MTCHNTLVLFRAFFVPIGKTVPKLDLIRKHLMIEGQIEKDCLVRILNEVTDIYRKSSSLKNFIRKFPLKPLQVSGFFETISGHSVCLSSFFHHVDILTNEFVSRQRAKHD